MSLVQTYQKQTRRIRLAAASGTVARFQSLDSYRDPTPFLESIIPTVEAAQQQTAILTERYMKTFIASRLGEVGDEELDLARYTVSNLRGVSAVEVYSRPFREIAIQMSKGLDFEMARRIAASKARNLAETDVQLANRQAASDVIALEPRVVAYRRVLSIGKNCELCVAASQQTYHRDDLMPVHPNCGCGVEPLFGEAKIVRPEGIKVVEHGELGPTLYDESHHFDAA